MSEKGTWTSEAREIAHTAFLGSQAAAPEKYWYVPYRTGVALLEDEQSLIVSHIGRAPEIDLPEYFTHRTNGRTSLTTDGIYECAGVSVQVEPFLKILIHAHGVHSLSHLMEAFLDLIDRASSQRSVSRKGTFQLLYNPLYVSHALSYESLCLRLLKKMNNIEFKRQWVNQHTVISI